MTDEEKKAVDKINKLVEYLRKWNDNVTIVPADIKYFEKILDMIKTYTRMIDENIEELLQQSKEIEELKQNIHLKEVYVLKTNDYIKGRNVVDELCNKKWEDKIKAKIEEYDKTLYYAETEEGMAELKDYEYDEAKYGIKVLQSLLEKE